ncbi:hypothetical protein [Oxalicibacterium solurbis]|uniref:hypothetical protein n=1 Tax=Oxalicibacterium solurbis TaxID=69280 RepID=UPI00166ADE3F|nr:hypothetical protein [Oxalicibacterium solurbis]
MAVDPKTGGMCVLHCCGFNFAFRCTTPPDDYLDTMADAYGMSAVQFRFFHANFPILFLRAALRFEAFCLQVFTFQDCEIATPARIFQVCHKAIFLRGGKAIPPNLQFFKHVTTA